MSKLKQILKNNNISNYKLAKAIGVSASSVGTWVKGENPSLDNLMRLSKYFNLPIDNFINK